MVDKRNENRHVRSICITPEQDQWVRENNINLSELVQKTVRAKMEGVYDEDKEAILDMLYDRFKLQAQGRQDS